MNGLRDFQPKLLTVWQEGYSRGTLLADLMAGLVVAIVALPLAIAIAIASGLRPEQGLYTAIVGGALVSLFGGSRVQIGGPTSAFIVLVAGIVSEYGQQGLFLATLMAGVLLLLMAAARLGNVIRFIPYPVIVGFTAGIALTIVFSQLPDALGLDPRGMPVQALPRVMACLDAANGSGFQTPGLFLFTLLLIAGWNKLGSRIPAPLIALVIASLVSSLFGLSVETIASRFGSVPDHLPMPHFPAISFESLRQLVSPALAIAILAAIESLLSATVADGLTGGRHRPNAELLAQGLANLASPLFGGVPVTGAIARTATNVRNGGTTPFAGLVHALSLLVILLVAGSLAGRVPLAALAAILVMVAHNMSERRAFLRLLKGPRSDALVLVITFLLTVFVDLVIALQVGVVLAALLFMRRMADVSQIRPLADLLADPDEKDEAMPELPEGITAYEINGSFCFGAARRFADTLLDIGEKPRVVILRMRHVLAMDATGLNALEDLAARFQRRRIPLLVSGLRGQPLELVRRCGLIGRLGPQMVFPTFRLALAHAKSMLPDEKDAQGA